MSKFKVGDRVKCVNAEGHPRSLTQSKIYQVLNCIQDNIVILDNEGDEHTLWENRFELVTETKSFEEEFYEEEETPKFKKGDIVRCLGKELRTTKGCIYEINLVYSNNYIRLRLDDGRFIIVDGSGFKKVESHKREHCELMDHTVHEQYHKGESKMSTTSIKETAQEKLEEVVEVIKPHKNLIAGIFLLITVDHFLAKGKYRKKLTGKIHQIADKIFTFVEKGIDKLLGGLE